MAEVYGVLTERGPQDWQILQQDEHGRAELFVSGRWGGLPEDKSPAVWLRLVCEDSGLPVTARLDWSPGETRADGTWSAALKNVPAGGLYRLETQLRTEALVDPEWARRGETRHCLGVGDLWVIAGQSNAAGYGKGPLHDPPELGVHLFDNAFRWRLATHPLNDSTGTVHPANREAANSGHAPWLHWARRMQQALHHPIGLVQTSLGGSALSAWNPTEPGKHPLFELLKDTVAAAGGQIKGVLWYQGCSDTGPAAAASYAERFCAAARAWREALRNPDLFIVTVQLNRMVWELPAADQVGWSLVREAQRQAPKRLPGLAVVPTLDLPLSDGIHTAPAGNMVLAERAAQAALGLAYGRDTAWRAPEAAEAKLVEERVITLRFENVVGRFRPQDLRAVPFRVEDESGAVGIEKVEFSGGPVVRLHLTRRPAGRTVVHGAFGADPPSVPHDMTRLLPMLGFHNLPVARA